MGLSKQQLRYYRKRLLKLPGELIKRVGARKRYRRKTDRIFRENLVGPTRPLPTGEGELWLVAHLHCESLRLPHWLSHYKRLGVDRFLIISNDSDAATLRILNTDPAVHVWTTQNTSFADNWHWMEAVLERYAIGRWIVMADGDELIEVPGYDDLPQVIEKLEARGEHALYGLLLDRYSDLPFDQVNVKPGEDPLPKLPYIDQGGVLWEPGILHNHKTSHRYPVNLIYGGLRRRVFGTKACLSKAMLVQFSQDTYVSKGIHSVDAKFSTALGIVWHTKFLQDFVANVEKEVKREVHYNQASEYKAYLRGLETGVESFYDPAHSIRADDYEQLRALGLYRPLD